MKKTLTKLMLVALVAILPLSLFAQKKQYPVERYFYISGEGGLSINHTDLANYGGVAFYQNGKFTIDDYFLKNFDGKLGLGYQLGKVIGINAKFGYGTLAGEKHNQSLIGFEEATTTTEANKFRDAQLLHTTLLEGNLNLTFNFTNLFFGYNPRRVFNFIPHIGIGGLGYKAGEVNLLEDNTTLYPAKTDYAWTYTVPVGAEINFNISRMLDFYIDYTFTWAGSDKLDQVQKVNDNIQVINDMYSSLNAGLRLKFNKKPCDIERMAAEANKITMRTNPDPLEEKDGKVCFDVIFTVPAEYFEPEAVMNITPTFNYNGGQIALDPVTFVGERVADPRNDFRVNYKNGGEFTKHYCTNYVPELENSKLMGNPMFYVYNGKIYPTQDEIVKNVYFTQGGDRTIADGVVVTKPECSAKSVVVTPKDNSLVVTWIGTAESFDLYLDDNAKPAKEGVTGNSFTFDNLEPGTHTVRVQANCGDDLNINAPSASGSGEITPPREPIAIFYFDYQSANPKAKAKLNNIALKAIAEKLAAGETITGFEIEGWASPENGDGNNNKLSAERAKAVEKAIKDQLKKAAKDFTFDATGFGSDWNLFNELVQNSNMKDKDQILRVINNAGSNKEKEIQNMKAIYNEVRDDILPQIRRAEVYVK